jgi:hypothetical protein
MEQDGEVLVRLRPRRLDDGLPVPLQLQLLEIDWLDSTRNSLLGGSPDVPRATSSSKASSTTRSGAWRPTGCGTSTRATSTVSAGTRNFSKRVPASSIIHLFDPKRPGQGRGITRWRRSSRARATCSCTRTRRSRARTWRRAWVSSSAATPPRWPTRPGRRHERQSRSGDARASTGDLGELRAAPSPSCRRRRQLTTIEPKPAGGHVEYVGLQLHIITAAARRHVRDGHRRHEQVNFSSARVRLQDVRRGFERTQWHLLIPRLGAGRSPTRSSRRRRTPGKIPRVAQYGVEFDTPKWDYVNPLQEAQADALQVANGLTS